MNATRWPSLTEFAKYLGREGLCRVEEGERGLEVAWIDNSPEALRRQDAIRKKERMDRGDEEREQRLIREQIERAEGEKGGAVEEDADGAKELRREEGEKIKLSFGKVREKEKEKPAPDGEKLPAKDDGAVSSSTGSHEPIETYSTDNVTGEQPGSASPATIAATTQPQTEKVSLKMGNSSKPKNVFATSRKNALNSSKVAPKPASTKPMSEAERIMKEEIERKRVRETGGFAGGLNAKRQRVS